MRVNWIDSWKGLLIALVVIGHVMGGAVHQASGGLSDALNRAFLVVYTFHMPAFFVVAGYLAARRNRGEDALLPTLRKRFSRLLVPYFVFGVASIVLYVVLSGFIGGATADATDAHYSRMGVQSVVTMLASLLYGADLPGTEGLRCNSVLWFLPCMFSVLMFDWVLARGLAAARASARAVRMVSWLLMAAGIALSVLFGHWRVPSLPYGLWVAPWYFAYLLAGRELAQLGAPPLRFGRVAQWVAFTAATALFVYVTFTWPCYDKFRFGLAAQLGSTARTLWGVLLSLWFARLADCRALAALGRASIGIMLMHKFVVLGLQFGVAPLRRLCAGPVVPCVAAIVFISIVATAVSFIATVAVRRLAPWALGEARGRRGANPVASS